MHSTLVLTTVVVCLVSLSVAQDTPFTGPAWQKNTAATKLSQLLKVITADNTSLPWYSALDEAQLFIESMTTTFSNVGDDMPYQFLKLTRRKKLIHTVGCIASAKLVFDKDLPYTGLFRGSNYALIRFSTAKAYDSTQRSFLPGLSFKLLRDGVPSADFMAMYSLECYFSVNFEGGQDSFNIFKHDLTNHVPDLSTDAGTALHALKAKFMEASNFPSMLGLRDFASFDEQGNNYTDPKFPFRLVFQPLKDLKTKFPDNYTTSNMCTYLSTLPARVLYNIYAEDQPNDTPKMIGHVETTMPLTASHFGDQYLFFQHPLMENDFALHPQWQPLAEAILAKQRSTPYFNGYPDLPDPSF